MVEYRGMPKTIFGRFVAYSMSEHHSHLWLRVFALAFAAGTIWWMRYSERIKEAFLS